MAEDAPEARVQWSNASRDSYVAGGNQTVSNTYYDGRGSGRRQTRFRERADEALEELAGAVKDQWRQEENLRRVNDPVPLPVRWTAADELLSDHTANITRSGKDSLDLDGSLAQVVDVFEGIPSRRLAVVGEPGAGKTVFAMRFTLDMLTRRQVGGPVPVIFGLHTWNPGKQSLKDWMAARLAADYPALGYSGKSGTVAAELVRRQSIIPVLDGLDEIAPALRADALRTLNRELDQDAAAIVTCRKAEYQALVRGVDVLTSAAVVELQPLEFADVADYLPRTTRKSDTPGLTTKWDPVLQRLRTEPGAPECQRLSEVLSIPLMISLARAIYSDTDEHPDVLLDARFTDRAAIERHLLNAFVPAVFSVPVTESGTSGQREWDPDDSERWLGFLARHLTRRGTRDLEWWRLPDALLAPVRWLAPGLVVWVVFGVLLGNIAPSSGGPLLGWAEGGLAAAGLMIGLAIAGVRSAERARVGVVRSLLATRRLLYTAAVGLVMGAVLGSIAKLNASQSSSGVNVTGIVMPYVLLGGIAVGVTLGSAGLDARQLPTTTPLRLGRRMRTVARRLPYAVGLGLLNGLLISLALGSAWGIGFASAQAVRIPHVPETFPAHGSPPRPMPGGGHYEDFRGGRRYVIRGDGKRMVEITGRLYYAGNERDGYFHTANSDCVHDNSGSGEKCQLTPPVEQVYTATSNWQYAPDGYHPDDPSSMSAKIFQDGRVIYSGETYGLFPDIASWVNSSVVPQIYGVALLAGELALFVFVPSVIIGCLLLWLGFPADATRSVSPLSVLRADRNAAIFRTLVIGTIFFPVMILQPFAIIPGVLAFALSAWARFQVARVWLAARGKLPWRLVAFLRDAHARGALRQAGAAYQFRHVRLQEQLATQRDR